MLDTFETGDVDIFRKQEDVTQFIIINISKELLDILGSGFIHINGQMIHCGLKREWYVHGIVTILPPLRQDRFYILISRTIAAPFKAGPPLRQVYIRCMTTSVIDV
jgi:hypothetical protein